MSYIYTHTRITSTFLYARLNETATDRSYTHKHRFTRHMLELPILHSSVIQDVYRDEQRITLYMKHTQHTWLTNTPFLWYQVNHYILEESLNFVKEYHCTAIIQNDTYISRITPKRALELDLYTLKQELRYETA